MKSLPSEYKKIIVLQEQFENRLLNELETLFNNSNAKNFSLLIPNDDDYKKIANIFSSKKNNILKFGYSYSFNKFPDLNNEVFILTASEHIMNIEYIVSSCPNMMFNIAALSEMSDKLLALQKYKNVSLYPVANQKDLKKLMEKSAVYLDINSGAEVINVVESAFLNNLLIFGFQNTIHKPEYTSKN
ncbi:hypothetical protein [Macrococcus armenti]|uniref:hypothetical protein n=1 Tax=Macrococcus armenti TaxID=2875764 RepID=UPI001CCF7210|nr:hypothetical protein [Macrococcus armenti]UBH08444.1 hypothetical protein LAU41_10800 [Macrococcus armenti]UBH10730.1 hypothetical protein LAU38_11000 [Macrococcus armenti]